MKEVSRKVVFSLLEFFFSDSMLSKDGDIKAELLALKQMEVHKVDNLATVLPGPSTEDSGTIDGVGAHVVVKKRIEVQVGHATHLSLQPAHLQFSLVVHLADELLAVLQLHFPFFLLLTEEIGALLLEGIGIRHDWVSEYLRL